MFVLVIRQREVGVPLIPLNALTGHRPALQRLPRAWHQTKAEHGVGFGRLSDGCDLPSTGNWDSGNPAFALSRGSHDGPPSTSSRCPSLAWHAVVPFTFLIQVSQQTQEPPSEFLPTEPGIQPGASWRTASDRPPGSPLPRGAVGIAAGPVPADHLRALMSVVAAACPASPHWRSAATLPGASSLMLAPGAAAPCAWSTVVVGSCPLGLAGRWDLGPCRAHSRPGGGCLAAAWRWPWANRGPPSSPVVMAE
jgi:hypothetical protein